MTASAGARGTVLIFWDYDTQWGADRSRSAGGPKQWGMAEFEHTERLLELHAQYRVPACFAVVGAAALPGARPYHDPAQVRRIAAGGHEVASHAHRHEWLPGLGRAALVDTLRQSREALEDCIGAPVVSFVPPYNQPFDHLGGGAVSWSERRTAGPDRTDLRRLCEALTETGYRTCRVAYRSLALQAVERLIGRRLDAPRRIERLAGIICLRLNTAGGFGPDAHRVLERAAHSGGTVVVYGHPHSLGSEGSQHERLLVPFLRRVRAFADAGRIAVSCPRDLAPVA